MNAQIAVLDRDANIIAAMKPGGVLRRDAAPTNAMKYSA
jgi:hypothetical protein